MDMMKKMLMAFAAALLFASCGEKEDNSGDFGQIKVPDIRQLEQAVGADDTQTAKGVTFSTEGAWTSAITQTRAAAPDWISISPDHGDVAGTYTMKITLETNPTAEARSARITVQCGTSKIEINVTQEASDNPITPTVGSLIRRIEYRYTNDEPDAEETFDGIYRFEYDKQNRIVKIDIKIHFGSQEMPAGTVEFTYPNATTLKMVSSGDEEVEVRYHTITLDNAGRAVEIRRDGHTDRLTFAYDADGYCKECRQYDGSDTPFYPLSTFSWKDGNLVALDTFDDQNQKVKGYSFTYEYTDRKNEAQNTNIDLNALLFDVCPGYMPVYGTDVAQVLTAIGRLGRRCANLTRSNMMAEEFSVETNGEFTESSRISDTDIRWEVQPDGRVTKTDCVETVQRTRTDKTGKTEPLYDYKITNSYTIHYQ